MEAREVRAIHRFAHISDQKAREVTRVITGMSIPHAINLLNFVPKKAAQLIGKVLRSAVANAENVHQIDPETLYLKSALAEKGPILHRIMPRARGSAGAIRKRMCHLSIILAPKPDGAIEKAGRIVMPGKTSRRPATEAEGAGAKSAAEARKKRVERSKKKTPGPAQS
jgi:large subunit ribosomal protein L22